MSSLKNRAWRRLAYSALVATVVQAGTSVAYAQEVGIAQAEEAEGRGLETIVVTARKRSENLQSVPVTVTALSSDTLQNAGVFQTNDLSGAVPNLQISSAYGTAQPNFTLRGIGVASETNANQASPVGVYVDEVYQAFRSSHGQQLYDLERIEVVRGPQGTLYGRNTTGGAVNFITRQPSLRGEGSYVTVGYGNYNRHSFEGALDLALVEDTLGIRIAGTYVNSDSYVKNLIGLDPGGDKNWGVRGALRWKPHDGVDITLKGYASKSKGGTEVQLVTSPDPNAKPGTGPVTFPFLSPYDRLERGLSFKEVEADTASPSINRAEGVVLTAKFDVSDRMQLTSISGYDGGKYLQRTTDCDGSLHFACQTGYSSNFKAFNQDLRLSYSSDKIEAIFGVYYGWDRINTTNYPSYFGYLADLNAVAGVDPTFFNPIDRPFDVNGPFTPITVIQKFDQTRRSKAVYGEVTYNITSQFSITGGLRYTKDKASLFNALSTYYDDAGNPRLITISSAIIPVEYSPDIAPYKSSGSSGRLSGRAIVNYKPNDDLMFYASYSRGYRGGAFNGLAYTSTSQLDFVAPETVNSYEGGFKARFLDGRGQLNGAVFYSDYKGQQVQEIVAATGILRGLDGRIKGIELEGKFLITDDILITSSLGLLDTKYDSGQILSGVPIGGNNFPYAPKVSFQGGFEVTAARFDQGEIVLNGNAEYTGKFDYDPFNDRKATGPFRKGGGDFWIFNSRVSYKSDNITLSAWMKNITNKLYFPYALDVESLGFDYYIRSQPRTFGAEVSYRF